MLVKLEAAILAGASSLDASRHKTARRFVTLGPRRGCPTRRGGQCGGGRPPGGVQGAASAIHTEAAGSGRDAPPKTRLDAWGFSAKSKTARRFVTLGPRLSDAPRRIVRGLATAGGGNSYGGTLCRVSKAECRQKPERAQSGGVSLGAQRQIYH